MDWEREAKPLLKAVGRAIDANEGERVSAESVNAQLPQPLDDALLDRRLGELHRAQLLDGLKTQQRAAPILLGLSARGRQQVSGWPGEGGVGGTEVSIVDSHIGQLALGDNNNMSIVNLFEVWERQVEQLGPEEEKERARGALRAARDVLTITAGGAGGRLTTDALRATFGGG